MDAAAENQQMENNTHGENCQGETFPGEKKKVKTEAGVVKGARTGTKFAGTRNSPPCTRDGGFRFSNQSGGGDGVLRGKISTPEKKKEEKKRKERR